MCFRRTLYHPLLNGTISTLIIQVLIEPTIPSLHISTSVDFKPRSKTLSPSVLFAERTRRLLPKKYGEVPLAHPELQPWECVQIDLCGPWTFKCVNGQEHSIKAVTMIDPVLRWLEIQPYDDKKSETISLIFDREWLCRYPRPAKVIYDNGTEFTTEFIELLLSYGIHPVSTTIKNPQANAIVERLHLTMADSIRSMELHKRPFDETSSHGILQAVAWGIRSTFHTALRASPGQVTFGRDMIINATYVANWKNIMDRRKASMLKDNLRENAKRISHDYKINDRVYVTSFDVKQKLHSKEGPYTINQVFTNGTVLIQRSPLVEERINIRRLFPATV